MDEGVLADVFELAVVPEINSLSILPWHLLYNAKKTNLPGRLTHQGHQICGVLGPNSANLDVKLSGDYAEYLKLHGLPSFAPMTAPSHALPYEPWEEDGLLLGCRVVMEKMSSARNTP